MTGYWRLALKKERVRLGIVVAFPILVILIYGAGLIPAQDKKIARLEYDLLLVEKVGEIQELLRASGDRINSFRSNLYPDSHADLILEEIEGEAARHSLSIDTILPRSYTREAPGGYRQGQIELKLSGAYHDFAAFLADLESKKSLYSVESLKMTSAGDARTPHAIELVLGVMWRAHKQ